MVWWIVAAMSALTFAVTVHDKVRAQRGRSRIRERTLFTLAFLGGSPGLAAGMVLAHHKVRKASFLVKFLAILFVQAALVLWWVYRA